MKKDNFEISGDYFSICTNYTTDFEKSLLWISEPLEHAHSILIAIQGVMKLKYRFYNRSTRSFPSSDAEEEFKNLKSAQEMTGMIFDDLTLIHWEVCAKKGGQVFKFIPAPFFIFSSLYHRFISIPS